jgi:hypothetical protein
MQNIGPMLYVYVRDRRAIFIAPSQIINMYLNKVVRCLEQAYFPKRAQKYQFTRKEKNKYSWHWYLSLKGWLQFLPAENSYWCSTVNGLNTSRPNVPRFREELQVTFGEKLAILCNCRYIYYYANEIHA